MIKRKTKKLIEAKFNEMKMNLENNYKDLAKDSLKELDELVERLKNEGKLKPTDYERVHNEVADYKTRLADYHH